MASSRRQPRPAYLDVRRTKSKGIIFALHKPIQVLPPGRIGRSKAQMAGAGFRARVLAYDPYADAETMRAAGIEKQSDLRVMLAAADFVSLHCVVNQDT